MIISEVGYFYHITAHEFAAQGVDHVVVVERDKQGITVEEQAKLCQIKVNVLRAIHTTHDKHIGRIHSVTVFQQQQIFYKKWIGSVVVGYGGIVVAIVSARTHWSQVFVDVDVNATHSEHFLDVAVKILVVVGSVGSVKAEPRHSHVFMGQLSQWGQSPDNYMHG